MELSALPSQISGYQASQPAEVQRILDIEPAQSDVAAAEPAAPEQTLEQAVEKDETKRVASIEEQAIRAAFLAQLSTGELLSVVRDPADNVLPQSPEAVV